MTEEEQHGFTTRAVGTWRYDERVEQLPAAPPIYQAATFIFDDVDEFAAVGKTKISGGYLYSRWANPTVEALARTVASLEGAEATACFSSGMAAITNTLLAFLDHGDHVVAQRMLYGGTHSTFQHILPRWGITTTVVDPGDLRGYERAMTDRTKIVYAETIANPTMAVADLDALRAIAHEHGARLVVDATFTSPYLLRVLDHGVDLAIHSTTKYLGGHHDVTGGVVSGRREDVERIRMLQIDLGGIAPPFEAWLTLRGIQTLALRMERVSENALALARFLEAHPRVERVWYPGLPSHPDHGLAKRLMGERFAGMLAFEARGGFEAGRRFLQRIRVAVAAASLGGTKTLVVHPPSVTHTQYTAEERAAAGITEGMLRVSVGIEDVADVIADFEQALA